MTEDKVKLTQDRVIQVHYYRKDGDYQGWGLHIWGDCKLPTEWHSPIEFQRDEAQGVKFEVPVKSVCEKVGFIIHKQDEISSGGDEVYIPPGQKNIWLIANSKDALLDKPDFDKIPFGDLYHQCAHWINRSQILWRYKYPSTLNQQDIQLKLFYSKTASIFISENDVQGYDGCFEVHDTNQKAITPAYLLGCSQIQVQNIESADKVQELVKSQLAIVAQDRNGKVVDATGVQIAKVMDEYFYYDGILGDYSDKQGNYCISVWAPSAQNVELLHFSQMVGGEPEVVKMTENDKGVWSLQRPQSWNSHTYQYRVTTYNIGTQKVEQNVVTDPYSKCTTSDGERTILCDMNDGKLMPNNWKSHQSPAPPQHPIDISLYELHIRDFSITDESVPKKLRGKYLAFDPESLAEESQSGPQYFSNGIKHLQQLKEVGLNHIHLLPLYDYGSVPEKENDQWTMDMEKLKSISPISTEPQDQVSAIQDRDGFNWGYDPVHFSTPEGSYSNNPDSTDRIIEFRKTVNGLHSLGFRVVLDVVYNHTFASGQTNKYSVLDKVVPGYYYRRFENGDICNSTCCNNTASEHKMFEKMIVDDAVFWAKNYKIDGYRFDIMAALMLQTMEKCRNALNELTLEKDGVDGKNIYIYGEPWGMGEFSNDQRGVNAEQKNLHGSGIGAFNDRIRNAAMGGSPFSDLSLQGFLTGLGFSPTEYLMEHQGPVDQQILRSMQFADWIKLSIAGLQRDYKIIDFKGQLKIGGEVLTEWGPPVAYCSQPQENVNYISCHDNQTLFDQVILKTPPHLDLAQKLRIHNMGMALVALGQGVAFFHAGCEILRSKSLDRDSYNSGDYFNRVDWSYQDNNFAIGLPPASKNLGSWPIKSRYLNDPKFKPTTQDIKYTLEYFKVLLRIRYSSLLFRLRSSSDIQNQLKFYNNGPLQLPGVIAYKITGSSQGTSCKDYSSILVIINARPEAAELELEISQEQCKRYMVHPLLETFKGYEASLGFTPSYNEGKIAYKINSRSVDVLVEPQS